MYTRLGGFGDFFFDPTLPQNSDGDFVSGNHKKKFLEIGQIFAYQKSPFVCDEKIFYSILKIIGI